MKIINKNSYNIMYDMEFINAGEVKEITDKKAIKLLLSQPNVEEYADIKAVKDIEAENKKLKEQLAKVQQKNKSKEKAEKKEPELRKEPEKEE